MFVSKNKRRATHPHNGAVTSQQSGLYVLPATDSVIQAMLMSGTVMRRIHGYYPGKTGMIPLPKVTLQAGQRVLLDYNSKIEKGEDGAKEVWCQAYTDGVFDDFWINENYVEWTQATGNSFEQMMRMFEECWDGSLMNRRDFEWFSGPLQKSLFNHYGQCKWHKPECHQPGQLRIAQELVKIFLARPKENAGLKQSGVGYPTKYYSRRQLSSLRDYLPLCKFFLRISAQGGEGTSAKVRPSAGRDVPFCYEVFLNVPAQFLVAVMTDLVPLLDNLKEDCGDMDIDSISVAPLNDLAKRADSICISVNSEKGFERVKAYLIDYIEKHGSHFVDESLCLTERFAKGASWSQDPVFSNVWEMDEGLLASVSRFLDRVRDALEAYHRKPPFFDFKSQSWADLKRLHQRVSEQMASEEKGVQISKKDLRQMDRTAGVLKIQGLSEPVTDWMDHFERYEKSLSKDRKTFLGLRMEALAQLAEKKLRKRNLAIRTYMRICERLGIDFFYPYRNLPIKPFTDDDLVIVSEEREESESVAGVSAPEALFLPNIDFPEEGEVESSATASFVPGLGREMTTFRSEQEEAMECVRDALSKAYMQVVAGEERQRLKTEKPDRPKQE
ncbi:hypothetical protein [Fulvitalea axinellae]|uniref:hypothetical protein n=1 Tax=Fulvitalea axinellae TaxID=1182444 RepID=UPI0030CA52CB